MELLDVYNAQHVRTGRVIPRNGDVREGERLVVVHVCVLNSRKKMLIQKRQIWKDRYPGCWDVSAGGFVRSGEESADAALRELREELGLSLSADALQFRFTEPFSYVLDDFYTAVADVSPEDLRLQAAEVSEAAWVSEEEILRMLDDGTFVDYPVSCIKRVFETA